MKKIVFLCSIAILNLLNLVCVHAAVPAAEFQSVRRDFDSFRKGIRHPRSRRLPRASVSGPNTFAALKADVETLATYLRSRGAKAYQYPETDNKVSFPRIGVPEDLDKVSQAEFGDLKKTIAGLKRQYDSGKWWHDPELLQRVPAADKVLEWLRVEGKNLGFLEDIAQLPTGREAYLAPLREWLRERLKKGFENNQEAMARQVIEVFEDLVHPEAADAELMRKIIEAPLKGQLLDLRQAAVRALAAMGEPGLSQALSLLDKYGAGDRPLALQMAKYFGQRLRSRGEVFGKILLKDAKDIKRTAQTLFALRNFKSGLEKTAPALLEIAKNPTFNSMGALELLVHRVDDLASYRKDILEILQDDQLAEGYIGCLSLVILEDRSDQALNALLARGRMSGRFPNAAGVSSARITVTSALAFLNSARMREILTEIAEGKHALIELERKGLRSMDLLPSENGLLDFQVWAILFLARKQVQWDRLRPVIGAWIQSKHGATIEAGVEALLEYGKRDEKMLASLKSLFFPDDEKAAVRARLAKAVEARRPMIELPANEQLAAAQKRLREEKDTIHPRKKYALQVWVKKEEAKRKKEIESRLVAFKRELEERLPGTPLHDLIGTVLAVHGNNKPAHRRRLWNSYKAFWTEPNLTENWHRRITVLRACIRRMGRPSAEILKEMEEAVSIWENGPEKVHLIHMLLSWEVEVAKNLERLNQTVVNEKAYNAAMVLLMDPRLKCQMELLKLTERWIVVCPYWASRTYLKTCRALIRGRLNESDE